MPRKIARRITPEYLHNAALYYLQRYAAATGRVRDVLTRKIRKSCLDHKDQNEAELLKLIDAEIETLLRVELLNDDRLGGQLVDVWRGRGMAGRMIGIKLQQRGFDAETIKKLLGNAEHQESAPETERDAAMRYLKRRHLGPYARVQATDRQAIMKQKQKAWAALARQGYSTDVINDVMQPARDMDLSFDD